jgi:uncharacterized membrane protein YfcA
MTPTLALAAVLSLAIGAVLGMLGGGGAILTLPMLVYGVHVEPKAAIATSLFVVGATSIVGTAIHARTGAVRWKVGAIFGAAAMVGAFGGGRLAHFVPSKALLVLFAVVMLVTAIAMLRGRNESAAPPAPLALGRSLALGAAVGVLSGLVGAGGGFLIVPALTLFGGLAMREAIATSLLIIAMQSFAGFAGHVTAVELDWTLIGAVTGAAVAGAIGGALLGTKVSAAALRRGFAWLVLAMGIFVIGKQLPLVFTVVVAMVTVVAVILATRTKSPPSKEIPCTTSPPSPH